MATDYQDVLEGLTRLRKGPSGPSQAAPTQPALSGGSVLDRYRQERDARFASLPAPAARPRKQDDGFDAGDVFGFLGKGLSKAVDVIDVGRAAMVSGTRELADLFPGDEEQASWQDFKDQFNRRATSKELLFTGPYFDLDEKGWEDEILGFATDVVLDPLTYTPAVAGKLAIKTGAKVLGGKTVRNAAEAAMQQAVRDGSSKAIAKTIAKNAEKAGLKDSPIIQNLIVEAAQRGRGALTEKGLLRVGADDAVRKALGLSTDSPGAVRSLLQASENLKGASKALVRTGPVGKAFRKGFVSKTGGRRFFTDVVFDSSEALKKRADAVLATATINPAKAIAQRTADVLMAQAKRELMGTRSQPGLWRTMSKDAARAATNAAEVGLADPAADVGRNIFRAVKDVLEKNGVDVSDLGENFVSHQMTDDWRRLMRKNSEARNIYTTSLLTEEGFQKFRGLRPGEEFLNTTDAAKRQAAAAGTDNLNLVTGTIDEINERSLERFGVKMFEDDIREIVPRYIDQAQRALFRANQIKLLEEAGFSTRLASKLVDRDDPEFKKQFVDLQKGIKETEAKRSAAFRESSQGRFEGIQEAKRYVLGQISVLQKRVENIKDSLRQFEDTRAGYRREIAALDEQYGLMVSRVQDLEEAAKAARGIEREALQKRSRRARRQLTQQGPKIKQKIKTLEDQIDAAFKDVATATDKEVFAVVKRAKAATRAERAELSTLRGQLAALENAASGLRDEYAKLRKLQETHFLGRLPTNIEKNLADANDLVEVYQMSRNHFMELADYADSAALYVQANAKYSIDALEDQIAELNNLFVGQMKDLPELEQFATQVARDDLRAKFLAIREGLDRPGNDVITDTLLKFEAVAAKADAEAWFHGVNLQGGTIRVKNADQQIKGLQQQFAELKNQKKTVFDKVADNMVLIGENKQMPEWLFEATKLEWVRSELPNIGRFANRYLSLFRGYAINRPGFHVRNAYSALFNMYLEAGSGAFKHVKKWDEFYRMVERNPSGYMDEAIKRFGAQDAELLSRALDVISATGAGQIGAQVGAQGFNVGGFNPFDPNNRLLTWGRGAGSWVENHVRGAHAYDVLNRLDVVDRSQAVDLASDVISKWHFDYTDITSFDQAMKVINPFWIFFSRNMALQSQTWLQSAGKINRSVMNFERTMNAGLSEEGIVPQYYYTSGATKLGLRGFAGKDLYFFSDLPVLTFPGEVDRLTSLGPQTFADFGPFVKIPLELVFDRQLFSDIPIDVERPEKVPFGLGRLPGAGTLAGLPGFYEGGTSGELLMNPELLNTLRGLIPGIGQAERLVPIGSEKGQERMPYSQLAYWLGLSLAENTPRAQQGELYRRSLEQQQQAELQRRIAQG